MDTVSVRVTVYSVVYSKFHIYTLPSRHCYGDFYL